MIRPTWFGPPEKSLFGIVHVPENSQIRGAVVICSPIGREQITTYRGVKQLAEKLCRNGLLVLRFDYRGLGDSSGEQQSPYAVTDWCDSIVEAVRYVRAAGARDVALVGLRSGALLAAACIERCDPLCALVLWDPVTSGRAFVREQKAAHRFSSGATASTDAQVELLGVTLAPSTISQLNELSLEKLLENISCDVVMYAYRSELATSSSVRDLAEKIGAIELNLAQQAPFVTPSSFVFSVPTSSIEKLSMAISRCFPQVLIDAAVVTCSEAMISSENGVPVTEIITTPQNGLFVINTSPIDSEPNKPTVVFFGTASEHRIGPSRLWVELSRQLAAKGITAIRFDRHGIGDSGDVSSDESTPAYSASARRDAIALVRDLKIPPQQLVLVGVCSGGWHAAYVARQFGASAVVMINMMDWSIRHRSKIRRAHIDALQSEMATRLFFVARVLRDFANKLQRRIPYSLWRCFGICRLVSVPELLLDSLWRRDIRTSLILTPDDWNYFKLQRGREGLQRLREKGYAGTVNVQAQGDHSLYESAIREFSRVEILRSVESVCDGDCEYKSHS